MATLERRSPLLTLKQSLMSDAVVSGAVGALSLTGARSLDSRFDLPAGLLAGSGAIAIAYAAAMAVIATRTPLRPAAGWAVVAGNVMWAAACVVLLFSDTIDPDAAGVAFVLVHIVGALAFAELQAMALRDSR